jgi:hypothetical protein
MSVRPNRKAKHPAIAAALRCIPLLFVAGRAAYVGSAGTRWFAPVAMVANYLVLSLFGWGIGYLYLRRGAQFGLVWAGGLALGFVLIGVNLQVTFFCIDVQTTACYRREAINDWPLAAATCLGVAALVLVEARDAWRSARSAQAGAA